MSEDVSVREANAARELRKQRLRSEWLAEGLPVAMRKACAFGRNGLIDARHLALAEGLLKPGQRKVLDDAVDLLDWLAVKAGAE